MRRIIKRCGKLPCAAFVAVATLLALSDTANAQFHIYNGAGVGYDHSVPGYGGLYGYPPMDFGYDGTGSGNITVSYSYPGYGLPSFSYGFPGWGYSYPAANFVYPGWGYSTTGYGFYGGYGYPAYGYGYGVYPP
jgi:hypothetical protein